MPKEGIEIPDFNHSEKNKLSELTIQSPIKSVKYIIDNYTISHGDAKYIVTHINKTYGQCNRCAFDKLDGEYIKCPKCGSLNFNWETDTENGI